MGALSFAAGAEPAFLSKPLVNIDAIKYGGVVVSSGDAFKGRAFDMSPNTAATSLGQADDTSTWTFQAKQYFGSSVNAQPVDTLALLRINFKRFTVQYRVGGGAWTIYPGADYSGVDFAQDHLILALDPNVAPNVDEWLVTVFSTQTPNQEKSLGAFLPCVQKFQAGIGSSSSLEAKRKETKVSLELLDGSADETLLLHNDLDYDFKTLPLLFLGITPAEEALHQALGDEFFLIVPQPGKFPLDWRYVRIVPNSYSAQPFSMDRADTRQRVAYSVEEVGKP